MKQVIINNFNGGIAKDNRTTNTNESEVSVNFDIQSNTNKITPYIDQEAESLSSGDITDKLISDVTTGEFGGFAAVGRNGSSSPTVVDLYSKDSSTDITATWTSYASLSGASGYLKNTLATYLGNNYLITGDKHIRMYNGSWNDLATVSGSVWAEMGQSRPFRHLADDLLYIAIDKYVYRTNSAGTAASLYFTFPSNFLTTSLTSYGNDLAVSISPKYAGKSYVALLDRISTNTSARDLVDWGEGSLAIVENIGGVLIGVSTNETLFNSGSTFTSIKDKKIYVKAYAGGSVETIQEIEIPSIITLKNYKYVKNNRLYFGCTGDTALYAVYKNNSGKWVVTKEHYIANGSTATVFRGFSFLGDYLFTMFDTAGGTGFFYRTDNASTYTNTSTYTTTINPAMDIGDRAKFKKLKKIFVSYAPLSANAQVVVKYRVDSDTDYTTILTETTDNRLRSFATTESTSKPFKEGYEYQFKIESTGGAEITEIRYEYDINEKV